MCAPLSRWRLRVLYDSSLARTLLLFGSSARITGPSGPLATATRYRVADAPPLGGCAAAVLLPHELRLFPKHYCRVRPVLPNPGVRRRLL